MNNKSRLSLTGGAVTGLLCIMGSYYGQLPGLSHQQNTDLVYAINLANNSDNDVALIMGGSGHPIPPDDYLDGVDNEYIQHFYPGFNSEPLFYPAAANGDFTGPKSLTFDESVDQGVRILDDKIMRETGDGNDVVVFGHSQSSSVISLEMANLAKGATDGDGPVVDPDHLHFVMTGDPGVPNGGMLVRFPGLSFPSLGTTFHGITPPDTPYTTDIVTNEYDGFADFPRYPINILADLNALLGTESLHPYQNYIDPDNLDTAFLLPGSADLPDGTGNVNYWMLPTENLPLIDPIRSIPVVGKPLADLVQPDLKILVNLGYGSDPSQGWSSPIDDHVGFGLFPDVDPEELFQALAKGAQQGVHAAADDLKSMELSDLGSDSVDEPSVTSDGSETGSDMSDIVSTFSSITHTLSDTISSAYWSLVPPTADVINTALITLPSYDVELFFENLEEGNLIDAVGLPIAADVGLGLLEVMGGELNDVQNTVSTIGDGIESISSDLSDLFGV
jgi:hypothetical protein